MSQRQASPLKKTKSSIAIVVNPMSGRDVRRVAARASSMTHEHKRDMVARVAAGADSAGVEEIYVVKEPFRIASMALEWMKLNAKVIELTVPLEHRASDTELAVGAFLEHGVSSFVSLGGDGTNRIITRVAKDIDLIPISTGTNNVFPSLIEPTIAGIVAGLNARRRVDFESVKERAKVMHVKTASGVEDIGLIDAVLLEDDFVGNFLPFDAKKIKRVLLTQALPDSVGISPIGGYLEVVTSKENYGLLVEMGRAKSYPVPISPGLFQTVSVDSHQRISFGEEIVFAGSGVLALDGDREHAITRDTPISVTIRRDGPYVIDITAAMRHVVAEGMMLIAK